MTKYVFDIPRSYTKYAFQMHWITRMFNIYHKTKAEALEKYRENPKRAENGGYVKVRRNEINEVIEVIPLHNKKHLKNGKKNIMYGKPIEDVYLFTIGGICRETYAEFFEIDTIPTQEELDNKNKIHKFKLIIRGDKEYVENIYNKLQFGITYEIDAYKSKEENGFLHLICNANYVDIESGTFILIPEQKTTFYSSTIIDTLNLYEKIDDYDKDENKKSSKFYLMRIGDIKFRDFDEKFKTVMIGGMRYRCTEKVYNCIKYEFFTKHGMTPPKNMYIFIRIISFRKTFVEIIGVVYLNHKTLEYKINDYMTLKLENNETNIYVNNQYFKQCKYLFIHIPNDKETIKKYDTIDSIEEAEHVSKQLSEKEFNKITEDSLNNNIKSYSGGIQSDITPEQEFWGHCSNLEAFYENEYDTRVLHNNLSFPLLKSLFDAGDPMAEKVFKVEIGKRLTSKFENTAKMLVANKYYKYLSVEEAEAVVEDIKFFTIQKKIRKYINENRIVNELIEKTINQTIIEGRAFCIKNNAGLYFSLSIAKLIVKHMKVIKDIKPDIHITNDITVFGEVKEYSIIIFNETAVLTESSRNGYVTLKNIIRTIRYKNLFVIFDRFESINNNMFLFEIRTDQINLFTKDLNPADVLVGNKMIGKYEINEEEKHSKDIEKFNEVFFTSIENIDNTFYKHKVE